MWSLVDAEPLGEKGLIKNPPLTLGERFARPVYCVVVCLVLFLVDHFTTLEKQKAPPV